MEEDPGNIETSDNHTDTKDPELSMKTHQNFQS